ncbi:peptide transporter family 2-like [Anthonomus grandis grandis]|uniref:peptide transporter family 2-like n=1 Tax=Anthonomus grandis grandis TaxID=2921223 RepID=UPI002165B8A0|nr:peptide transporter family 2-like [Anthonomus grandis grandis]
MENDADAPQKLKFPKATIFLIANEVLERFYFYGCTAIIVVYLNNVLDFSERDAKSLFHAYSMLIYFFPLLGGVISDSWLGKFNTIVVFTAVYSVGSILLALTTYNALKLPKTELTITSLMIIAIGGGLIKPCIPSFGGDQFILPDQQSQLTLFFYLFYFAVNAGSLLAMFITPLLRSEVDCFGETGCYPLAFSLPAVFMVLALVVFFVGKPWYRILKPVGNVVVNVFKCIWYAIRHRKEEPPVDYWLDRSEPKFGADLVKDINAVGRVLLIFLPLPVYFALYYQQHSAWVLQASKMDGDIGFYTILPEQLQIVNPLMVIILIPTFTYIIYPLLAKCRLLRTSLQRMCCGGFITVATFVVSGFVSLAIEASDPVMPGAKEAHIRVYDPTECDYHINISENVLGEFPVRPNIDGYMESLNTPLSSTSTKANLEFFSAHGNTTDHLTCPNHLIPIHIKEKNAYYIYVNHEGAHIFNDVLEKSKSGQPLVRTIFARSNESIKYEYAGSRKKTFELKVNGKQVNRELQQVPQPGKWTLSTNEKEILTFRPGGCYIVLENVAKKTARLITMFKPSPIHILWQLPQYFLITSGEILFSIAGLEFAYSEAPVSMKAVVNAFYLLNSSFGNLIVIIIEQCHFFKQQSYTFFLYSCLMAGDMVIFTVLAIRYKYLNTF